MDKIIIEEEMLNTFSNMFLSGEGDNIDLAMGYLDNRDKDNVESEDNFKKLMTMVISNNDFFPTESIFIVKIHNKPLILNGRASFNSESEAKKHLSLHLTKFLGTKGQKSIKTRYSSSAYFIAMKKIFKGGLELRNFLVNNNLVEIVDVSKGI